MAGTALSLFFPGGGCNHILITLLVTTGRSMLHSHFLPQ